MELGPFKIHAVPDHSVIKYAKKKMKQAKSKHEGTQMYLKQILARVLPGINDFDDTSSEEELLKKVKQSRRYGSITLHPIILYFKHEELENELL